MGNNDLHDLHDPHDLHDFLPSHRTPHTARRIPFVEMPLIAIIIRSSVR